MRADVWCNPCWVQVPRDCRGALKRERQVLDGSRRLLPEAQAAPNPRASLTRLNELAAWLDRDGQVQADALPRPKSGGSK